jgi:hypothetical protein
MKTRKAVLVPILLLLLASPRMAAFAGHVAGRQHPAPIAGALGGTLQTETVDVRIVLDEPAALAAFEVTVAFDAAAVRPVDVALGPVVPPGSQQLRTDDTTTGRVTIGSFNARGNTAVAAGDLATITFEVIGAPEPGFRLDPERTGAFDRIGLRLPAGLSIGVPRGAAVFLPLLENGG